MAIKVRIPPPLRSLTSNQQEVEADGADVSQVLADLEERYPGLRERLRDETGSLRRFVNIYLNDEDIRFLQGEGSAVKPGDLISIIPAIAGGAPLSEEEIERYSRHIILPEVGGKGQAKIREARVLVVGTGGLGAPCSLYLAAAGVGTIGLVDSDVVDLSNLQRQVVHFTADLGRPKTRSAAEKLRALNPDCQVVEHQLRLDSSNVMEVMANYQMVVDGTDNFPARYLINDACVLAGKPLSHAGIFRFDGQVTTIIPGEGPCYRCIFPEPPPPGLVPSCQEAGILGVVAGVIGVLQATEVLKLILGRGRLLKGRMLIYNALDTEFREVRVRRDPGCPLCGDQPTIAELMDYQQFCAAGSRPPAAVGAAVTASERSESNSH